MISLKNKEISMVNRKKRSKGAIELRKQAEDKIRQNAAPVVKDPMDLSPEETLQMLHELQVHQIELELQNEELRRAYVALDTIRERYFDLYDLAPVGYCTIRENGLILEANLTVAALLDVSRNEMVNQPISRFILKEDQDIYYFHRKRLVETAAPQICELRMIRAGTQYVWVRLDATAVRDESGATVFRVTLSDITERKKADEKICYLSFHDNLTGLYNRAYLEEEMKRLNTERQLPIGVIMVDLNGLKLVNDTYGHVAGDKMLNAAASVLQKSCRKEDIIARWGGDEFVILLPQIRKADESAVCERIKDKCRHVYVENVQLSMALGLSILDSMEKSLETTLNEAEGYMYQQKFAQVQSGRGYVLAALLKTLGKKSFETEAHEMNMQHVALKIAVKAGLSDSEQSRLKLLIKLHDIGKINLPKEILCKKEPLSDDEWQVIKKHPEMGYRIARATVEFAHMAEDILAHHERWDGRGYPHGVQGKEISLMARITSIADAYEVMANGRPYKKAMPEEKIIGELKRCSGTQFDPELVEILLSVLDRDH